MHVLWYYQRWQLLVHFGKRRKCFVRSQRSCLNWWLKCGSGEIIVPSTTATLHGEKFAKQRKQGPASRCWLLLLFDNKFCPSANRPSQSMLIIVSFSAIQFTSEQKGTSQPWLLLDFGKIFVGNKVCSLNRCSWFLELLKFSAINFVMLLFLLVTL